MSFTKRLFENTSSLFPSPENERKSWIKRKQIIKFK